MDNKNLAHTENRILFSSKEKKEFFFRKIDRLKCILLSKVKQSQKEKIVHVLAHSQHYMYMNKQMHNCVAYNIKKREEES